MKAWEQFLNEQQQELGEETVDKWLRTLKILHFDACNLYLEASNSFQAIWFEEHMRTKVQRGLFNNNQKHIKVHLTVADLPHNKHSKRSVENGQQASSFQLTFDTLNPAYRFEHFIPLEGSLLPYKLLLKQIEQEGKERDPEWVSFNPIFLHGASGTGKTHLLMAMAHQLRESGKKVIYVRAETFTDHLVSAIRSGSTRSFRDLYRQTDALLIDDIQVFARRAATQEEFFHTFNALHLLNKQIILTANCSPGELQGIEPRLVSRFEWGIVLSLAAPTAEEVRKILEAKCKAMQFKLHSHVKAFLVETFSKTTKSLIGALEALILRAHLHHSPAFPLTLQHAKHYLSDLVEAEQKRELTPQQILHQIALYYGLPIDDILGKSQSRECTQPRQMAMYLCRQLLKMPFAKIGELFKRDHSTVMSSVRRIEKEVELGKSDLAAACQRVQQALNNLLAGPTS